MTLDKMDKLEQIRTLVGRLMDAQFSFWRQYSSWNSWQFWFLLVLSVGSLFALYMLIDRKRALLIGFFGFNVHVWLSYFDHAALALGLWTFPYKIVPYFTAIEIDAAFAPVMFMLVYQWTLKHNKNYYLYTSILCVCIALLWRPALSVFGLFRIESPVNYVYVLLGLFAVMLVSKWITNIFVHFQKKPQHPLRKEFDLALFPEKERSK